MLCAFQAHKSHPLDAHFVKDPIGVTEATDGIKKTLDAKSEAADVKKVCAAQSHLLVEQQQKLLTLMKKYASLSMDPWAPGTAPRLIWNLFRELNHAMHALTLCPRFIRTP